MKGTEPVTPQAERFIANSLRMIGQLDGVPLRLHFRCDRSDMMNGWDWQHRAGASLRWHGWCCCCAGRVSLADVASHSRPALRRRARSQAGRDRMRTQSRVPLVSVSVQVQ